MGFDGKLIDVMYFWVIGILLLFFDNVLIYFVFFNFVGGDV